MTIAKLSLLLLCLAFIPLETKEAKVTPLFSKDLPEFPGKEGVMITVEYPPGSIDPIHRHNADAFVYVLEGSIRDAGERRKGSDSDTWPDLLRRPGGCSRSRPQRQPDQTGEIRRVPCEGQRRTHLCAGQLNQKTAGIGPIGTPDTSPHTQPRLAELWQHLTHSSAR